jgi:hypothetical protein
VLDTIDPPTKSKEPFSASDRGDWQLAKEMARFHHDLPRTLIVHFVNLFT